jgi:hypothetical protein
VNWWMGGCGCPGGWYGPRFARWPTREERIEWLEEYQRDLEERAAEVADEIRRLRERARPAGTAV